MTAKLPDFDVMAFLKEKNTGAPLATYRESQVVFAQGDPANTVFYVHSGQVKVTVISERGKEAVVAIRGPDEFCGEEALTGTPLRLTSTAAISMCEIVRIEKNVMVRLLHEDPKFGDYFLAHLFDPDCARRSGLGRSIV